MAHPHPAAPTPKKKSTAAKKVSTKPIKRRVEASPTGDVKIVDSKVGTVNTFDKIKAYYHTAISLLGTLLILLNQVLAVAAGIPDYGPRVAGWVSVGIGFVTIAANFLKSNEQWVNGLP